MTAPLITSRRLGVLVLLVELQSARMPGRFSRVHGGGPGRVGG
ncbi:hypothetical protein ACFV2H_02605 [Streptomyces sp. NPDC059629]